MFKKLSEREEYLAQIVNMAIKIHKESGPGLLESVYAKCFAYEISERQLHSKRQTEVPIIYKELRVGDGLRLNLLVENLVIVELKAQEDFHPVWEAQMLNYLKLTDKRPGLLINFHVSLMKDGIKRLIL
jgi:GxxExxY protein